MSRLWVMLLMVWAGSLSAEPVYRVPTGLNEGERGAYVPQASYEILGVSIEEASLDAIQSTLGAVRIENAPHGARNLCYLSGPYRVEFSVSNLGFGYEVTTADQAWPQCGTAAEPAVNGLGIKMGMRKADVLSILGKPSERQDKTLFYTYWVQEQLSQEDSTAFRAAHNIPRDEAVWFDVYSTISVSFENDRVSRFSVNTAETY